MRIERAYAFRLVKKVTLMPYRASDRHGDILNLKCHQQRKRLKATLSPRLRLILTHMPVHFPPYQTSE